MADAIGGGGAAPAPASASATRPKSHTLRVGGQEQTFTDADLDRPLADGVKVGDVLFSVPDGASKVSRDQVAALKALGFSAAAEGQPTSR